MDKESNPIVASTAEEIYVSRIQPSYYVHGVALDSLGTKASSSPPAAVVWQRAFHRWYGPLVTPNPASFSSSLGIMSTKKSNTSALY